MRELEDERIDRALGAVGRSRTRARAVAADPHVVLVVDRDAVVRLGPVVSRLGTAPRLHEIAGRIELQHRRRRHAALAERRLLRRADLVARVERVVAVHDEHVIVRVHAHADDVAEHPVVGQRLGPERIDLEARRLHHRRTRRRVERALSDAERGERRDEQRAGGDLRARLHFLLPADGQSTPSLVDFTAWSPWYVELLDAFALVRLDGVEVALGVGRDAVHGVELAGLPAAVAERSSARRATHGRGCGPSCSSRRRRRGIAASGRARTRRPTRNRRLECSVR